MSEYSNYEEAVQTIKTAILQSQYDAARGVNEKQLMLYYGIGKYISSNFKLIIKKKTKKYEQVGMLYIKKI